MIKFAELTVVELTIVVFFTQIIFIWLRTINISHIAHKRVVASIISGNGIAITWMISTTIGVSALLQGEPLPIIAHLIGGSIGTFIGLKS